MSGGGPAVVGPGNRKLVAQQSTVWTRKQHAVCVRNAIKTYGSKSARQVVLDGLNMTVPKGCIYGLLGASGCGKTTLLSCIVGRRRLNSGEIWVLGGQPGSRGSGVPGPRIGYMPQDIALYGEFTIRETLLYFGWIAGMKTDDIEEKIKFFVELLMLPGSGRYVKSLSGGQQRRVSLAATFLHEPELLILDEPTVGVDPVLRQGIWDYLVKLTSDCGTTVIITTHYIDETKQATTIGLMRGGKFLAEESPSELLRRYNTDSLEDAFLKLSIIQNKGKRRRSSIVSDIVAAAAASIPELQDVGVVNEAFDNNSEISGEFGDNMSVSNMKMGNAENVDAVPPEEKIPWSWKDALSILQQHHMKALIWKNLLWMWRNVGVMLFTIGIPVLQIVLFCFSIGKDPVGLHLAIVNHEVNYGSPCTYNTSCVNERLSCRYLNHVTHRNYNLVYYNNEKEAEHAVIKGYAWGKIVFPSNFSESLGLRLEEGKDASNSVLDGSDINVNLDMSNMQISFMIRRDLIYSLQDFATDMSDACEIPQAVISTPVKFNTPIYGPFTPNFTDFAAPGVMLTIIFFMAVAQTSGSMLTERNEGILERCLVSGITGSEILVSHVVTQFCVMLGQSLMVLVVALAFFGITNHGNFVSIVVLILMCGTCGMTYGCVVACLCDNERTATYLSLGSFLPFVMLCGIIWPVEGMYKILRTISFFLPLTLSTESMRCILARGWGLEMPAVYSGFVSTALWILIFMNASILLLKFKKG